MKRQDRKSHKDGRPAREPGADSRKPKAESRKPGMVAAPFPDWIVPMAATLTAERFTGPEWIFERKLDGIRLLAFKRGHDVHLFSRNRLPQDIPALAAAIAELPVHDAIFDGEMTWDRASGYYVFDVMWLDGRDVTGLPLVERQALLAALPWRAPLHL